VPAGRSFQKADILYCGFDDSLLSAVREELDRPLPLPVSARSGLHERIVPPVGRLPALTKLEAHHLGNFVLDRGRPSHGSRDRTRALANEGVGFGRRILQAATNENKILVAARIRGTNGRRQRGREAGCVRGCFG
jgi:hypothetical protein